MSDLISRSALIEAMEKKYEVADKTGLNAVGLDCGFIITEKIIKEQPTVEAKPVVHGKWVHGYNCSECGWSYMDYADADSYPASGNPLPNFCGNCGADMRKKVE